MQMILSGNGIKAEQVLDLRPGEDLQTGCGLKTGSIVKATVIFASDSNINIKLDNGAVLRATVQGMVTLAEGDEALFFVSQNDGRRIVLTPVDEVSIGWTGSDVSEGAAAPTQNPAPMKWSPDILAAIEHCGCTPTDELAGRAAAILKEYPEAQAETAVFIAAGEMEPNPENIEIGNMLNRASFRTGQEIGRLLSMISVNIPKDIPNKAQPNRQDAVSARSEPDDGAQPNRQGGVSARSEPGDEAQPNRQDAVSIRPEPGERAKGSEQGDRAQPSRQDTISARPEPGEGAEKSASTVFKAMSAGEADSGLPGTEKKTLLSGDVRQVKTADEMTAHYPQYQPDEAKAGQESVFTAPGRADTARGYPDNGPGGSQKFDPKAVQSLAEELFVPTDGKCTGERLQKVVTGLPARIDILRGFAAGPADAGGVNAGHLIGRAAAALKYMNSIPGAAFVQIPLSNHGMQETADLYVLRRRRHHGGKEQGELCAVLALDMKNLGHVEALLRIRGRGMTIRLTADGEKQASFLSEHLGELRKPLYQAGYELTDIQAAVSQKKITPADAAVILGQEERSASGKIDMKI